MKGISFLQELHDGRDRIGRILLHDRFMLRWIERGARLRRDLLHLLLAEQVHPLIADDLHSFQDGAGVGFFWINRQGAFQVIDDRQHALDDAAVGKLKALIKLRLHALLRVLELSGGPRQSLEKRIALRLEVLCAGFRRGLCPAFPFSPAPWNWSDSASANWSSSMGMRAMILPEVNRP